MEKLLSPSPVIVTNNNALELENIKLFTDLSKQSDIVIDFSSLKTCLNPMGIEESDKQEQVNRLCMLTCNVYYCNFHLGYRL